MIEGKENWVKLERNLRQIELFLDQKTRKYLILKGISNARFILLVEVYFNPGLSLTELYEKMCVTLSTVSNLTDQLVISGLLSRERRSDDRRVIELNLTQEGHNLLEDILKYRYSLIKNILEVMPNGSVSSFVKIIEEFVSHV
ncbi:MarR family winged helix-turn-helix transcriptional regulator [Desulfosporosinus nitroreducens]|uniref:MarR family winged helix-turn-helix transcriptional regulator n=1 Tax=Desulfosporosinus nitroreducens TaxID=2018668 RepID=UPI00207C1169|nr:MarR family winged helix-turn-helix transcriptional regulator [Desulfosporosinus nitroreducens]MCO1603058.1 MarR family winged helix-turn-helix transcriptional regulator [Desulfosporosinus nitroreducens]